MCKEDRKTVRVGGGGNEKSVTPVSGGHWVAGSPNLLQEHLMLAGEQLCGMGDIAT